MITLKVLKHIKLSSKYNKKFILSLFSWYVRFINRSKPWSIFDADHQFVNSFVQEKSSLSDQFKLICSDSRTAALTVLVLPLICSSVINFCLSRS